MSPDPYQPYHDSIALEMSCDFGGTVGGFGKTNSLPSRWKVCVRVSQKLNGIPESGFLQGMSAKQVHLPAARQVCLGTIQSIPVYQAGSELSQPSSGENGALVAEQRGQALTAVCTPRAEDPVLPSLPDHPSFRLTTTSLLP